MVHQRCTRVSSSRLLKLNGGANHNIPITPTPEKKKCLVERESILYLTEKKWCNCFYVVIVERKTLEGHRVFVLTPILR